MKNKEVDELFKQETADCKHIMSYAHKFPVLTSEQEKQLFEDFRLHRNALKLAYSFNLAPELLYYHVEKAKEIQDKLVNSNLKLVIKEARKFMGKGIHLIDLISYGIDGLIYTIQIKFRPELGYKLSTYATTWIRQRIRRALENLSKLVRTPGNVLALITKLDIIYGDLIDEKLGLNPTPQEISNEFMIRYKEKVSPERVQELGRFKYQHVSLDDCGSNEDTGASMLDFLMAENTIEQDTEEDANRTVLFKALRQLEDKEALLIAMKAGLLEHREFTKKEICSRLKITPSEFTELEAKGMEKLQLLISREEVNLD